MHEKQEVFTQYMDMIKLCKEYKYRTETLYQMLKATQHQMNAVDARITEFVLSDTYDPQSQLAESIFADYMHVCSIYKNIKDDYNTMHDRYCACLEEKTVLENNLKHYAS